MAFFGFRLDFDSDAEHFVVFAVDFTLAAFLHDLCFTCCYSVCGLLFASAYCARVCLGFGLRLPRYLVLTMLGADSRQLSCLPVLFELHFEIT